MLAKIRTYKIFSILSICAYLVSGIIFISPVFIPERFLNGNLLGTICGVMFLVGMLLQLIQICCDGPEDLTYFFISEPTITEEEADELLKMLEEFEEKIEKTSPPTE